ncbi:MAG: hypothetical protein QW617_02235 [Acidilobaceae archaeon]
MKALEIGAAATAAVSLALVLTAVAAPPPLLYVLPAALATLAVYLHIKSVEALRLGLGAILTQLILSSLALLRDDWNPSAFPVLALASHLILLSAIASLSGHDDARIWSWLSLALLGICWGLEVRHLQLLGAPAENLLGRVHILLLAVATTATLCYSFLKDSSLRGLLGTLSVASPILTIGFVQGGLLAKDVYRGDLLLSVFALYSLVTLFTQKVSEPTVPKGLEFRKEEREIVSLGLTLAFFMFLVMMFLEVFGFSTPREHAKVLASLIVSGAVALVLFSGTLAGSLLGAVGAVLTSLASSWLLTTMRIVTVPISYVIGTVLASLIVIATRRRPLRLFAPFLVALIVAPLVLSIPIEPIKENSVLVGLNSTLTDKITDVSVRIGVLEDLDFDMREKSVRGRIDLQFEYKGRVWTEELAFKFYWCEKRREWVFEKPLELSKRVGGDVVKIVVVLAPSLEAFLQVYYIASLASGKTLIPEPTEELSLAVKLAVYRSVEESSIKIAALTSLPGAFGLTLELLSPFSFRRHQSIREFKSESL